jgi:putative colanic acid biosynthesis glycosyltransferase
MQLPTISIVTVTFNAKNDLENTIKSVSEQTYPNIDYIIVDGDSTDGTKELLKYYNHKITKWISEKDSGLYDAMNKGITLASGDFIYFLNSGDTFFEKNTIEEFAKNIDCLEMIYFGNVLLYSDNLAWKANPIKSSEDLYDINRFLPHHQSIFYPRSFYTTNSYDLKFKIVGDIDFTLRACKKNKATYIEVNLIKSEFQGFGNSAFKLWKTTKNYYLDKVALFDKHNDFFSILDKYTTICKFIIKYLSFKLGGFQLMNLLIMTRSKTYALLNTGTFK